MIANGKMASSTTHVKTHESQAHVKELQLLLKQREKSIFFKTAPRVQHGHAAKTGGGRHPEVR